MQDLIHKEKLPQLLGCLWQTRQKRRFEFFSVFSVKRGKSFASVPACIACFVNEKPDVLLDYVKRCPCHFRRELRQTTNRRRRRTEYNALTPASRGFSRSVKSFSVYSQVVCIPCQFRVVGLFTSPREASVASRLRFPLSMRFRFIQIFRSRSRDIQVVNRFKRVFQLTRIYFLLICSAKISLREKVERWLPMVFLVCVSTTSSSEAFKSS